MLNHGTIEAAISAFGDDLKPKFAHGITGEPEDKLRSPLESLLQRVGALLGHDIVSAGQAHLHEISARPDFAIYVAGALIGHLEAKAPGKGANPTFYVGHDARQWEKFKALPNLIYTDGNAWGLYRNGEPIGDVVTFSGDVRTSGKDLATSGQEFLGLLSLFLAWTPTPPRSARELALTVARLCRLLRDEVLEVLQRERAYGDARYKPFTSLAEEWRNLLFPEADDRAFADSYAQTVTFALLLARSEGIDVQDVGAAAQQLSNSHGLLGRALQVLTTEDARAEVETALSLLSRILTVVHWGMIAPGEDGTYREMTGSVGAADNPWVYFYEEFLAAYDPVRREEAGAYYTPAEVVRAQVRLVQDLLTSPGRFNLPLGFADERVVVVDPAMGTGSYLLRIVQEAADSVEAREGEGAVPSRLEGVARRIIGFEQMTGPFAVAELQISQAIRRHRAKIPASGLRVFLTDTLSDPYVEETQLGAIYEPIARSRRAANEIKKTEPVLVCIGNPPYDRHPAGAGIGGWVRWGSAEGVRTERPLLDSFKGPDIQPGHIANLYNLYVYFWRWGLWKVFEAHKDADLGVVAFITSSSFLSGPGFAEMRAHMRRLASEIWVIDLGGGTGLRPEDNVFPIEIPVAITICLRLPGTVTATPAVGHYLRVRGKKADKLGTLAKMRSLDALTWRPMGDGWRDTFVGVASEEWTALPSLFDLLPWVSPGVQVRRTWPIGTTRKILNERWSRFAAADSSQRSRLFHPDVHRAISSTPPPLPGFPRPDPAALRDVGISTPAPAIVPYGYRSFDRRWILADSRLITTPTPGLWTTHSDNQIYLTTQRRFPLSDGPALTATANLPDYHHFRGSYGGAVLPLWRDREAKVPNVASGLVPFLSATFGREVATTEMFSYVAGVLGHGGYTSLFETELSQPGPRVPLTRDGDLFSEAVGVGKQVLWLHTFAERFADAEEARPEGTVPQGVARVSVQVPTDVDGMPLVASYDAGGQALLLGSGRIEPISREIWGYSVSGMRVLQKWLSYRRKKPAGRASSPLDQVVIERWQAEWTTQLLELIWTLERVLDLESIQNDLLVRITQAPLISTADLTSAGVLPIPAEDAKPVVGQTSASKRML